MATAARGVRAFTITTLGRVTHTRDCGYAAEPYLRMSGQWLEAFGFHRGARVTVTAEDGRLMITLAVDPKRATGANAVASHSSDAASHECDAPSN